MKPSTVVSKRMGNDPETHYMLGPQRATRAEAEADLRAWLWSCSDNETLMEYYAEQFRKVALTWEQQAKRETSEYYRGRLEGRASGLYEAAAILMDERSR